MMWKMASAMLSARGDSRRRKQPSAAAAAIWTTASRLASRIGTRKPAALVV